MKKRGFTLIELLVVIAIIAILAAILFPVMTSAKKKAQQTQCASNMKQLMTGIRMYCDDNTGGMPLCFFGNGDEPNDWSGCIRMGYYKVSQASVFRYIKNARIFACPTEPSTPCTYSMNQLLCSLRLNDYRKHRVLETVTSGRASRIIVLFEEKNNNDSYCVWTDTSSEDFSIVHLVGGNYAFADGHVAYKTQAFLRSERDRYLHTGARDTCLTPNSW